MRRFRLVFLDPQGRVADFQDLQFASDEEALAQVRSRRHGSPVELWSGGRLVGRMEPPGNGADEAR